MGFLNRISTMFLFYPDKTEYEILGIRRHLFEKLLSEWTRFGIKKVNCGRRSVTITGFNKIFLRDIDKKTNEGHRTTNKYQMN